MSTRAVATDDGGWINGLGRWVPSAALGIYLALSLAFFAGPGLTRLSRVSFGAGNDHSLYMWVLTWWPYAIFHRLNPFITTVVYAPAGFNLAWATSVPAIALLAAPLTLTVGPVITFNVLMLLAPALAAWSAFLLCRHLTRQVIPALVGGYVFGFSSFEIGHIWAGHLALVLTSLLPLAVLLCLVWYEGKIGRLPFIALLATGLVLHFCVSQELFATTTLFGVVTLALAFVIDKSRRDEHLRLALCVLCAYLVAGVVLSPYLFYVFMGGSYLEGAVRESRFFSFSTDLANYLIPTPVTALGGAVFEPVTDRFAGNIGEQGAYLGIPLMLITFLAARTYWRSGPGRTSVAVGAFIALCSLGPTLEVLGHGGRLHIPMPWVLFSHLPFLDLALPARFTVYLALFTAIAAAVWLHESRVRGQTKGLLAALSVAFLLPKVSVPGMHAELHVPEFFDQGVYQTCLRPGEIVLLIPYSGRSMLWQALTGMYFRMTGGYLHYVSPPELARWPILPSLRSGTVFPGYEPQLEAFLRVHEVRTVIVTGERQREWKAFFSPVLGSGTEVSDVTLYRAYGDHDRPRCTAGHLVPIDRHRGSTRRVHASAPEPFRGGLVVAGKPPVFCHSRGLRSLSPVHCLGAVAGANASLIWARERGYNLKVACPASPMLFTHPLCASAVQAGTPGAPGG